MRIYNVFLFNHKCNQISVLHNLIRFMFYSIDNYSLNTLYQLTNKKNLFCCFYLSFFLFCLSVAFMPFLVRFNEFLCAFVALCISMQALIELSEFIQFTPSIRHKFNYATVCCVSLLCVFVSLI